MERNYYRWYSPNLEKEMELYTFGHEGPNIITFPTSKGRYFDYQNFGLVDAMSWFIDNGRVQLTCLDSNDKESWYNFKAHPAYRVFRHTQYDKYVYHEVIPFVLKRNPPYIGVMGCSFGGYHAMNFGLRHPDVVHKIISLSGYFDIKSYMDGYYDDNVYFNNPVDFMYNLNDPYLINLMKKQVIIMATSPKETDSYENHKYMSYLLSRKGIPHIFDAPYDAFHDWGWWHWQIKQYL